MTTAWRETALVICRLLGDTATGRPADTTALPDADELLGFCKAHRLTTAVSAALRAAHLPDELYATLHRAADADAFHQTKNDLLTASLLATFDEKGIPVQPLKGAALQAVYPDGWIRTATDTDLLLDKAQLDAAAALLEAEGFTRTAVHGEDVAFQKPPRTVIELHTALGGYSAAQRQALKALADTPFTVNEHYVYTLFHLYKHVLFAGAGVRMCFDVDRLRRAVTDRAAVERWLDAMGLLPFEQAVHTLCGILFDGDPCTAALEDALDFILLSGTFGTADTYRAMRQAAHPITKQTHGRTALVEYGFDLPAMTARYPVLARHRWLYPVCAVRRVIHGALFKRTVLRDALEQAPSADRRRLDRVLKAMQIL